MSSQALGTPGRPVVILRGEDHATLDRLAETVRSRGLEAHLAEDPEAELEMLSTAPACVLVVLAASATPELLAHSQKLRAHRQGQRLYVLMVLDGEIDAAELDGVLGHGVDDLLCRPFGDAELGARLGLAERTLRLQTELRQKDREIQILGSKSKPDDSIDPVMEIPNRKRFDQTIVQMHAESLRYGVRYGVMVLGVDHFEAYCRRYGETRGDQTLGMIAHFVQSSIRAEDMIFRYEGDGIALILRHQQEDGLSVLAERLRQRFESLGLEHLDGEAGHITISAGAVAFDPGGPDSRSPATWLDMLRELDDALDQAKGQGRNRVVVCVHRDPASTS